MAFDITKYLPGFRGNTAAAEKNIGNQLTGLPSTGPARNKAAYFGATSGLPNSGVSNALGYDLYNQDAQQYQQQGFDNLLKMITSYPGNAFADPSQQFEQDRYSQEFNDRRRREELARQEAAAAQSRLSRPRRSSGLYRMPGGATPMGTSVLPIWAR